MTMRLCSIHSDCGRCGVTLSNDRFEEGSGESGRWLCPECGFFDDTCHFPSAHANECAPLHEPGTRFTKISGKDGKAA